jgi:3-hydroxyisobutyrate dehydrogenase
MKSNKVGIIGLGNIGTPIAMNVLKGGYELSVFDVRPEACAPLKSTGAIVRSSCFELAAANDYVISLVRDVPQTKEVLHGSGGLWNALTEDKTLIIMSTISPEFIRDVARRAAERHVTVIDAAISGAEMAAREGTLAIMVGGDERVFQDLLPLFKSFGKNIFRMGPVGSGMVVKLVNNAMRTVNLYGTREGLKLAIRAGVDAKRLFEVVNVSTGQSWGSDHWERDQREVEKYRRDPMSSRFSLMAKDREIALELAEGIGVEVPLLRMTKQVELE